MSNKIAKAKRASSEAADMERKGVFIRARQLWAVAVIRWEGLDSRINAHWCKSREHYCSVMSMDEEEE